VTPENRAHTRQFGQGPLPALAIHCTLGHSGAWRGVGTALQHKVTLTAIDLPGHGKSPPWDPTEDLHRQCTAQAAFCLTEPAHLIGHSFGATVALRLAAEMPERVLSLTLIEPVFFAVGLLDAPDITLRYRAQEKPIFDALNDGNPELAARLFNRRWGDGTKWEDIPGVTRQYMADRLEFVLAQSPMIFDDNAGLLAPGVLDCAKMPCLLLQGDGALPVIDAIQAALLKRLPNARRAYVKGAGHMSPITAPKLVAREILDLIEKA
jgi:pimeloyl-ACP methyl ester carboxylesterase